jgi:O-acetyl-ADP-ribose deacetylase (regulator of RNase III)
MKVVIRGRTLELVKGDITGASVDAIVNAANQALAGGGGVDGAIHRAGGPDIMRECRRLGGCPTGGAVATTAGRLSARHVIHAVAPVWLGGSSGEEELLSGAYRSALQTAAELGDRSIAFPSLGTGAFGYPVERAARVALRAVSDDLTEDFPIESVTFYLFSDADLEVYGRALRELLP